jgi:hypothetical protein
MAADADLETKIVAQAGQAMGLALSNSRAYYAESAGVLYGVAV